MSTDVASRRLNQLTNHFCAGDASISLPAPFPVTPWSGTCADLCDSHASSINVLPPLKQYGQKTKFHGTVVTLKVFEDNGLVRSILEKQPGHGRVLVIDGAASLKCALVGDMIASFAVKNNWAGIVVIGAIRDSDAISKMDIGIRALGTCPVRSVRRGGGHVGVELSLSASASQSTHGVLVKQGDYLYADGDGVLISRNKLH